MLKKQTFHFLMNYHLYLKNCLNSEVILLLITIIVSNEKYFRQIIKSATINALEQTFKQNERTRMIKPKTYFKIFYEHFYQKNVLAKDTKINNISALVVFVCK